MDMDIWLDFSSMYFEQGNLSEAIAILYDGIKNLPDLVDFQYRMVAYLYSDGQYNEALNFLQQAITKDSSKLDQLFEYLPDLEKQSLIMDIINRYSV
jgi:tetratricopeptide (TPR) repeat protein